jgi:DNA-binding beta-propeller fold protein YncE
MFELLKRSKRILFIAAPVAAVALLALTPAITHVLKRGPLYQRYSKWRYNWRSPSDLGAGKDAAQIILEGPMGLAEDDSGNLYVSDRDARFVWKIEPSGRATVIAGTGKVTGPSGVPRSRVLAGEIDFASPEGLVIDKNGNILVADSLNHAIFKIDSEGYLTYLVGNGKRGFSGDGGQATAASLAFPYDVRLDSKGNLYIADVFNHCIRKVDADGLISTVAGTGVAGYSGDGGPAVKARLNMPYGILLDKEDNLLIADSDNNVVRRVGSDGIIRTIAGNGQRGYEGDGGPALAAKFDSPQAMAIDIDGRLYIGDEHNNAIRYLEPEGKIQTLIGTKGPGYSGDNGPAAAAQIADPENLLLRKDGSLLISVRDNSRLRVITPDGIIKSVAGKGPTSKHDYFAPIHLTPVEY